MTYNPDNQKNVEQIKKIEEKKRSKIYNNPSQAELLAILDYISESLKNIDFKVASISPEEYNSKSLSHISMLFYPVCNDEDKLNSKIEFHQKRLEAIYKKE